MRRRASCRRTEAPERSNEVPTVRGGVVTQPDSPDARNIEAPVAYQGGKSRIAGLIVDQWWPTDRPFVDLCCGSGAVTIEMVNRGFPVDQITMVDQGPWGLFWESIGMGTFCMDVFRSYLRGMPADPKLVKGYMQELSREDPRADTAEVFIILQAGSFGGKALWIADGKWCNASFRSYWEPTMTSNRRSHVNPMMPMPDTLLRRVDAIVESMAGVDAYCCDARQIAFGSGHLVYIDPPYEGTTAYGYTLDVEALFERLKVHNLVYVSEGHQIGNAGRQISTGRLKGGISGERSATAHEEWLSVGGPVFSERVDA
jgi:site-specific DNA-adenine methylase